jgi:hypothetical protein
MMKYGNLFNFFFFKEHYVFFFYSTRNLMTKRLRLTRTSILVVTTSFFDASICHKVTVVITFPNINYTKQVLQRRKRDKGRKTN